ncbi:hypothetical protein P9112_005329 [Eukaryota sp. TZLM1-RC]
MYKLLILSTIVALTFACGHFCPPTEKEALLKLHEELHGESWTKKWDMKEKDHCKWHGIECVDGSVTVIDLQDNNLQGKLPREFACFPRLQTLYLQKNKLKGKIPDGQGEGISCLMALKHVDLSNNKFNGKNP